MISENEVPSIVLDLHRATHHTLHALAAELSALDLNSSEINTLANIALAGSLNVRELSEHTGLRATTLTGVLDRLQRRGLLVRELDAADRRSFRISLTPAGRRVAAQVHDAVTHLESRALAGLSARDLAGYHAVVRALQAAC